MMVDLVVRNARRQNAVVPDLNFKDGVLHLHPDVSQTVFQSGPEGKGRGEPLAPLQGRVLSLDEEAWIALASGEEHLIRFDLRELLDLNWQTGYAAEFQVTRFGKGTLALPATESPSVLPR